MKTLNRIISLLMVALMIITAVPFTPVSAIEGAEENYTLTVENICTDSSLAENSAISGVCFLGSTEFDGCYGNQLSGVAKELYDSLVKTYATDRMTGKYIHTFETCFVFNAEISDGFILINDELEEIQTELNYAVQMAIDAFVYDCPEVFWLKTIKSSYGISASGNSESGYIGIIDDIAVIPVENYEGASDKLSQYAAAVNSALDSVAVTESRYGTLKSIHDYICSNAWYNLANEYKVHSSEPFFIGDGGMVCEGYAKTLKILCDRTEIPCVLVSGNAGGPHMWNYVQMDDGKWYLVDVTWDDQESKIYDTYFLANANTIGFDDVPISEERTERNDFSGTGVFSFSYPVLSSEAYTAHIHEWDAEYTVDAEPTCTEKGSKSIHCRICDAVKSVTELPALGHRWNEGMIDVVSTCKTHGIKTYICQNNSTHQYTEQLDFDADNHAGGTYLKDKSEATCTAEGYTGDICCSGCNAKISTGHKIPVKPHVFTSYISDGNATCLTDGTKTAVCDVCNKATETIVDPGSKNNAKHKYTVHGENSATCTQDGTRTYICDVCETAAYMEIIPATGHKGGTATCKTKAKCIACGEEYGSLDENNHKNLVKLPAVASTCTETGLTEGEKCADCGKIIFAQKTISKKEHNYKAVTQKASLNKNGKTEIRCSACGYVSKTTVIYAPKTVKLSASSYTYNGKTRTPSVTVKDSKGKKLKKGTDYTVKYSKGRKSTGKYTVTVVFKGKYSGTKKLNFTIVPAKVTLSELTAGSKALTAAWKTVSGAAGYEVQYSTSKKFTKKTTGTVTIKKAKTKKTTIKKLKKGKKYYVKVRAYKTVGKTKIYGAWSAVKNVKVK